MPSINDLASRKAYITGQLNAGGGTEGMLTWWREYKKVDKELQEAFAEAEAKKLQAPAADTSTRESIEQAASGVSDNEADDEADNDVSDEETSSKGAASDTTPKTKRRKVTFQLPESPENTSPVESSDESSSVSPIDWTSEKFRIPGEELAYESPDEINYHGFILNANKTSDEVESCSSTNECQWNVKTEENERHGSPDKSPGPVHLPWGERQKEDRS